MITRTEAIIDICRQTVLNPTTLDICVVLANDIQLRIFAVDIRNTLDTVPHWLHPIYFARQQNRLMFANRTAIRFLLPNSQCMRGLRLDKVYFSSSIENHLIYQMYAVLRPTVPNGQCMIEFENN